MATLDRDLTTAWLDAALIAAKRVPAHTDARTALAATLAEVPLGDAARKKTLSALTRIWLQPVTEGKPHARWAVQHSDRTADWRILHVGMMVAGEPFFRDLLTACSFEQRARGRVDTVSLRARLRDTHGAKRGIDIAVQRGVKTLRSLGLLTGDRQESVSVVGGLVVDDRELAVWLVRCVLLGRGAESIAVEDLSHAPELFAVRLPAALPRAAAGLTKHVEGVGRTVLAVDP